MASIGNNTGRTTSAFPFSQIKNADPTTKSSSSSTTSSSPTPPSSSGSNTSIKVIRTGKNSWTVCTSVPPSTFSQQESYDYPNKALRENPFPSRPRLVGPVGKQYQQPSTLKPAEIPPSESRYLNLQRELSKMLTLFSPTLSEETDLENKEPAKALPPRAETPVAYYRPSPTTEYRSSSSSSTMTSEEVCSTSSATETISESLLPSDIAFVTDSASPTGSLSSEEIYSPMSSRNVSPTMMPSQSQCCVPGCSRPVAPVLSPVSLQMQPSSAAIPLQALPLPQIPMINALPLSSQPQALFPVPPTTLLPPVPLSPVIPMPMSPAASPPLVFTPPPIRLHSPYLPAPGFVEWRPVPLNEYHQFVVEFHHRLPYQPIIQVIHRAPLVPLVPPIFY